MGACDEATHQDLVCSMASLHTEGASIGMHRQEFANILRGAGTLSMDADVRG